MIPTLVQRVVSVTPAHIEQGERSGAETCALALALRSVWPDVNVGTTYVWRYGSFLDEPLEIGDSLREWVQMFDRGETVGPIEVAIDIENHLLWKVE